MNDILLKIKKSLQLALFGPCKNNKQVMMEG